MIEVGERHRALSDEAVDRLAASINELGLRHPITIRLVDDVVLPDGEICDGVPYLVAGRHRLAAAKKLGWQDIECVEVGGDEIDAELWEISENLHRLDLSKEQRDEHIRRYAELLEARRSKVKPDRVSDFKEVGAGRGNKGIAAEIAVETGLSQRTVRRALNPPSEPKQVKPAKSREEQILSEANAIINAWNRASAEAREMALEQMDGPVMDNCRAG